MFGRLRAVGLPLVLALMVAGAVAVPAAAAGVSGDRRSDAIAIGAIPWTVTVDTTAATSSKGDPGYCFSPDFGPDPATVWFTYTAATSGPLGATTFGSDYDTTLYVLSPGDRGQLELVGCSDDTRTLDAAVRFDAVAGETYFFVAGASPFAGVNGGTLVFNLDVGPVTQVVDLDLDATATLARGVITVTGTVSCSAPADLGSIVIAEVSQPTAPTQPAGVGFLDVPGCPEEDLTFAVPVESEVGTWRTGEATAQIIYAACNEFECANEVIDLTLLVDR